MNYIHDININTAVVHVIDNNCIAPKLTESQLDLNEKTYKYIYKHLEKIFKSDNLKCAKFTEDNSVIKKLACDYFKNRISLIDLSKNYTNQLFSIMKFNQFIPFCDLIIADIATDRGHIISILKLDYIKNYTHSITSSGIDIIENSTILPGSSQKINKAAFILQNNTNEFDLFVLDRKNKKMEDEYGNDYWMKNFLECEEVITNKDNTKNLIDSIELWVRGNIKDTKKSLDIRKKLKESLVETSNINIDKFVENIVDSDYIEDFKEFLAPKVENDFNIDKEFIDKKFKKIKLNLDKNIDLALTENEYNDKNKFRIINNTDGTVDIVLKNIIKIIEK
ncbi:nucleoid-associated protein [Clostridium baratii]|uniref:nucleoid-associated protein n=1 Tax=Clostridium baratii TaxID=1561 RepID=UPI0005F2D743|nr:nucleoid-associated protein [Clostridium baratii]KJU70931.1 hypothetical protein UC77_12225 [Clostridium baratii]